MIAADLLPETDELTAETARHLIDACVAEARALRDLPGKSIVYGDVPPEVLERAERLAAEWRRWAEEARRVWERVKHLDALPLEERKAFLIEFARGEGLGKRDLAELRRRWDAMQRGEYVEYKSVEEMRRAMGVSRRS